MVNLVDADKIAHRIPNMDEIIRRLRWEPRTRRVVYRDPDTKRLIPITDIPDVAIDDARLGTAHDEKIAKLAENFLSMDDANMMRAVNANHSAFFSEVREIAAALRGRHAERAARKRPRLQRRGLVAAEMERVGR